MIKNIILLLLSHYYNAYSINNIMLNRRTAISMQLMTNSLLNNNNTNNNINKTSTSNIYFNGELNEESCLKLSQSIIKNKINLLNNKDKGDHINLYIQSPGGSLLPTLAVVDDIINSEVPIYTYVRGYAASAATLLSVVGSKRYIYNHSLMMIHSVKTSQEISSYNEAKNTLENLDIFMKVVKDIYLENTNIDINKLDTLLLQDSWLTSTKALEYNLVDEVI